MRREIGKPFRGTLSNSLLIGIILSYASNLSAQENKQLPVSKVEVVALQPAITEADIVASYYPQKYPVTRSENLNIIDDVYQSPYKVSLFSSENGEDSTRLWSQTQSIFAYGFGVIGIISLLPEDISNWDKEQGIYNKWFENVSDGPVWDRDTGPLNLIGHPYFGGVYYQVARKSGYRQWDAFVYSALMSTFYWEYGIESFAEVPSIQDLVITPVLGWAYGEWAFTTEMDIRANGDTVLGSSFLGSAALIFLDPVDSLSVGINNVFGKEIIKAGTGYVRVKNVAIGQNGQTENKIQFNVSLQLGEGANYSPKKHQRISQVKDPVDISIIGVSYGFGQVLLDDYWQVQDDAVTEYSLGLYFSKKFSTRVSYSKAKVEDITSGNEKSYENYSLDGQYYFNDQDSLRPYLTAGFGEMMWGKDEELKTFQVNVGTGLHYKISNKFALQVDWRHYYSKSQQTSENNIAARLVYLLGNGER
jgi:outer membrane protein W